MTLDCANELQQNRTATYTQTECCDNRFTNSPKNTSHSDACELFDKVNEYVAAAVETFVVGFGLFSHKPIAFSRDYLTFASIATVDDEIHGCVLGECETLMQTKKESNTKRQAVSITLHQWIDRLMRINQKQLEKK